MALRSAQHYYSTSALAEKDMATCLLLESDVIPLQYRDASSAPTCPFVIHSVRNPSN